MYKYSLLGPNWFNSSDHVFCNIPDTPDTVFMDNNRKQVMVLQGVYMDMALHNEMTKYHPIIKKISNLG